MESQRFDHLSRLMASGASRRAVLRGLFGGALAGLGLRAGVIAQADKVDICHYDADTGTYEKINVSRNALAAHLAHGDNGGAGCPDGYQFNLDTCACVNECAGGEVFQHCGLPEDQFAGSCLPSFETGELICVTPIECSNGAGCERNADCPDPDGEVCIVDVYESCGATKCAPLYPYDSSRTSQ